MLTNDPSEVLMPGDIFDLTSRDDQSNNDLSYIVTGFKGPYLCVAELGGQNRNDQLIHPAQIPQQGEFNKWKLSKNVDGLRDDYARSVFDALRSSMGNLRCAEAIDGASTSMQGTVGEFAFETYVPFADGLFHQAVFTFGGDGIVKHYVSDFDLEALEVLPPEYILSRNNVGRASSYAADVMDLSLTETGAASVKKVAARNGLLMYSDMYIGSPLFAASLRDRPVGMMRGYLPGEEPNRPKKFTDLASAHRDIVSVHSSSKTKSRTKD